MKWIRGSMSKIDLVEGEKKIAYIVYQNYRSVPKKSRNRYSNAKVLAVGSE